MDKLQTCDKNEIKISVVLPVYNVEPWIGDCIESLKRQTLKDLEFVFVDDCGSDNSMKAVEEWAAEDVRVRILRNEKNMGSGPSRNRGIDAARGEYLSFIDPHDWVDDVFYELLYKKAKKTKAIIVKGIRIPVNGYTREAVKGISPKAMNRCIRCALRRNTPLYCTFIAEHQSAIYKRDFLIAHPSIRYGTSRNAQDTTFLLRLCLETENIAFEDEAIYYYVQREGAVTDGYSVKRSRGELDSLREKIDTILNYPLDEYAYWSFGSRMQGYLNNCYAAFIRNENANEEKEAFINAINEQIKRFPDIAKLCRGLPSLSAIYEYRELLPGSRIIGLTSFADCLDEWVSFLIRHPDASSEYSKACAEITAKKWAYKTLLLLHLKKDIEEEKKDHNSISMLDKVRRKEVARCIPSSILFLFLKQIEKRIGPIIRIRR